MVVVIEDSPPHVLHSIPLFLFKSMERAEHSTNQPELGSSVGQPFSQHCLPGRNGCTGEEGERVFPTFLLDLAPGTSLSTGCSVWAQWKGCFKNVYEEI